MIASISMDFTVVAIALVNVAYFNNISTIQMSEAQTISRAFNITFRMNIVVLWCRVE